MSFIGNATFAFRKMTLWICSGECFNSIESFQILELEYESKIHRTFFDRKPTESLLRTYDESSATMPDQSGEEIISQQDKNDFANTPRKRRTKIAPPDTDYDSASNTDLLQEDLVDLQNMRLIELMVGLFTAASFTRKTHLNFACITFR